MFTIMVTLQFLINTYSFIYLQHLNAFTVSLTKGEQTLKEAKKTANDADCTQIQQCAKPPSAAEN